MIFFQIWIVDDAYTGLINRRGNPFSIWIAEMDENVDNEHSWIFQV